jgi:hypothetical protein
MKTERLNNLVAFLLILNPILIILLITGIWNVIDKVRSIEKNVYAFEERVDKYVKEAKDKFNKLREPVSAVRTIVPF